MEYSAVSQPPETPCIFIQRGTSFCTVAAQMTCVFPKEISTEPVAFGAMSGWKVTGRSWSGVRESERGMGKAESRNGKAERGNDGKLSPAYRLPSGFCFLLSK